MPTANNPATSSQNSQALTLQCSDDDTAHLFCDEALVTVDNPQDVQTCWCELQPCLCLAGDQEDEQDDATVILPQENTIEPDIMQVDAFTPDLVGAPLTPQSQLSEDYVDVHQDDISLGDLLGLADGQGTQSVEATPLEIVTRTDSLLPIQSTSCGSDQSPVRDCMAASGSGSVGVSPIRLHLTQQEVRAFRSPGAFEKLVDMVSRRLQERRPDDYKDIARRALQSFTEVRCPFAACPVSHVVTPPACRTQQAPPCLAGPDSCDVLEVTRANMWSSGHFRALGHLQPVKNNNCLGLQGTRQVCIKGSNAKGKLMQMITDCHSRWHSADQRQWGHHAGRKLRPSKRNLYPLHLRLTYHPPKGIMDCCLPTSACVWRPSDYNLTGTTQTCGCGLRGHRACQQLRLHINFYRKCNLRWSCKGSAPKAAVCCQEPTLSSWESACAKARATFFMIEDSHHRSLIPRTASPIPGLWVHHAGPALGRLRMLITKRSNTFQPDAPYLMHGSFVTSCPPAVSHAIHAVTRTIGTVPWPGTSAYRGRGQRAHRACQNLSLHVCQGQPMTVSKPCRGLRTNVSSHVPHKPSQPCSPSRFSILAYSVNTTHNMPICMRGSYVYQHKSSLQSMVTDCTLIPCPLELPVPKNCSGITPCRKVRAGGHGACNDEHLELEPVHVTAPVGSLYMSQCAARLRGLAPVSHGTQWASCLVFIHQPVMWPSLCSHRMPEPPTLGEAVNALITTTPALRSKWVPQQLARTPQQALLRRINKVCLPLGTRLVAGNCLLQWSFGKPHSMSNQINSIRHHPVKPLSCTDCNAPPKVQVRNEGAYTKPSLPTLYALLTKVARDTHPEGRHSSSSSARFHHIGHVTPAQAARLQGPLSIPVVCSESQRWSLSPPCVSPSLERSCHAICGLPRPQSPGDPIGLSFHMPASKGQSADWCASFSAHRLEERLGVLVQGMPADCTTWSSQQSAAFVDAALQQIKEEITLGLHQASTHGIIHNVLMRSQAGHQSTADALNALLYQALQRAQEQQVIRGVTHDAVCATSQYEPHTSDVPSANSTTSCRKRNRCDRTSDGQSICTTPQP